MVYGPDSHPAALTSLTRLIKVDNVNPSDETSMPEAAVDYEAEILAECQEAVGYTFRKPELLRSALTHTSGANTRQASFERLEFLGDAVLGLVCVERLYHQFPEYQEGDMTKVKSAVVSRVACAQFSQEIGLGEFLFLGRGMQPSGDLPSNMLADVFESVVGAIYLDGGMKAAKPFIVRFLDPEIDRVVKDAANNNYKSLLQQVVQKEFGGTPRYQVLDEQGPDHHRSFKIAVVVSGERFPAAWGPNKKVAESRAAQNALARIQGQPIPFDLDTE
jgi:ribonuclease-3